MKPSYKTLFFWVGLILLSVVVFVLCTLAGPVFLPLETMFRPEGKDLHSNIFWNMRLPRVCLAFVAGAGLSVSGMAFQAIFRNPLATPFTLGVASGASLGAALSLRLGLVFTFIGFSGQTLAALTGAFLSVLLVYGLTRVKGGFSTSGMLLAGVAISYFFSSFILFIQYISDFSNSFRIIRWLMGGLEVVGFDSFYGVLPYVLAGCLIIYSLTHELNQMLAGEEMAISRGVHTDRVKKLIFFAASLIVGGVVATCGPIGFVGLMVPHMCRLLIGPDHRVLLPTCLIAGGIFLVICDTLARSLIAPAEIPVGVITALLGGPFFIWILLGSSMSKMGFFSDD